MAVSKNGVSLVCIVIDPQNDFCIPNGTYNVPTGALLVPGAYDDMKRLAKWIKKNASKIEDIHATLDSHHLMDVAHPMFWKNSSGQNPSPFTIISYSDVEKGVWVPVAAGAYKRMLEYTKALEVSKRYPLCIWPPHCLIGTPGSNVVPELMEEFNNWCKLRTSTIDFVTKGSNVWTEHYSAVKAEVPDPSDPSTQLNTNLIQTIEQADILVWAGEAGSHCLGNSMRDCFDAFGPDSIKKSVVFTDCTSPVPGFESNQEAFFKEFASKGVQFVKSTDFLV